MRNTAVLLFCAFAISASVYAFSYDIYKTKDVCETNNGFWCYRCQGTGENGLGKDTCLPSSANCTYSCSTVCGADCTANSQCISNLTDDSCQYAGSCSSCRCVYTEEYCPQNGTISSGYCYYGNRQCGYTGCSVSKCALAAGQVCDPANGCVAGTNGESFEDYRCVNNDVYAKKTLYVCNATACSYSKYDTLVERCGQGCIDGRCDDGTCNLNGLVFDCNRLDGYFGSRFCLGSAVYRTYRNYSCGGSECSYAETQIKEMDCNYCKDGTCSEMTNTDNNSNPVNKPAVNTSNDALPGRTLIMGKKIYNGWLFGRGDLAVSTKIGSRGTVNFTVADTNNFGTLSVVSGTNTLFYGKPGKGNMLLHFSDSTGNIIFTTSSSGWLLFAPATYDVRYVVVEYV